VARNGGNKTHHYFPSLIDRLRDRPDENLADWDELRDIVMRDLSFLLNARNHPYLDEPEEVEAHPSAARSVLNFGVPDTCGRSMSPEELARFVKSVETAVRRFEPRLKLDSREPVRVVNAADAHSGCVRLQIRGELKSEPIPEWLCIQTDLDFESGRGSVGVASEEEAGHG